MPPERQEIIKAIHGDSLHKLKELEDNSVDSVVTDPPYGLSFMGKKRDYDVPSKEIREEALRVLKPGGHLLAFAGTRTQHRMAVNIEDAGFEIRDMIARVYGSGFPKSLNIGKAVDKLQGNERKVVGEKHTPDGKPMSARTPNSKDRYHPNHNVMSGATKHNIWLTKGNSPREGRGTGLKPALEPITLARKPISEKNIAENCLRWGVGGMNIDECRVETEDNLNGGAYKKAEQTKCNPAYGLGITGKEYEKPPGRFPANFIHDGSDEVVELFPGEDEKSASRFFYQAKASKGERNKGLEGFERRQVSPYSGDMPKVTAKNWGDEDEKQYERKTLKANHHPTVKPVKLMQYLVRLITPKGGVCLDPFMGSGTTGIACKLEGMSFIGIEREAEYIEIAKARIEAWGVGKALYRPL